MKRMRRRERLEATLRGEPVDRPAVCFYEITGFDEDPGDPDPFNIFSDPTWLPVLKLAREQSDAILRRGLAFRQGSPDPLGERTTTEQWLDPEGRRMSRLSIRAGKRTLTALTRRDKNVNTVWTLEHLLKNEADLEAWLALPRQSEPGAPDSGRLVEAEARVGDAGIVMFDMGDPLCQLAGLFEMGEFLVLALTRTDLVQRALEMLAAETLARVERTAQAMPGRLWRIYGPEYASPPYLPPRLFRDLVTRHDRPLVEAIQRHGGFARIHCHGRIRLILDAIAETGCLALDPIEPPPQGDIELAEVRERYGRQMVLFGNLEASDLENLDTPRFRQKVQRALEEGMAGVGRGFVLMPSACPYGRKLPELALRNYEAMLEAVERY